MFGPYLPPRWQMSKPGMGGDPGTFPHLPGQKFVAPKTPILSTKVATAISGKERRVSLWSAPRWLFKIDFDFLRSDSNAELQTVLNFFLSQAGQFSTFNYYDPTDFSVTGQPFGTGDGTTTTFRLARSYGHRWAEPVLATVGIPQVFVNGVQQGLTTYGIANGQVTFVTAPAAGTALTWTGMFLFVCRFDADQFDFQRDFSTIWSLQGLTFRSVKAL